MTTTPATVETSRPLGHWLALGVLLTAAVAAAMVWWVGVDQLLTALRELSWGWLAVAAVLEALALACLTRVYAAIFRVVHDELPAREAMTVALGAFSLSQVLPGGGAAGGVFAAHRLARRSDAVTGTATVVLFGALSMGTLGVIISAGATISALSTGTHREIAVVAGVLTVVLVVALVLGGWFLAAPRRRHATIDRIAGWTRRDEDTRLQWRTSLDRQHDLLAHPTRLLPAVAWSAANWSFDIGVLAAIAQAAGLDLPLLAIIVAYGVANLASAIPLTPGGIGLVEAGITGTLVAMGADAGPAAVVALGYRLVGDLLPVAITGPIALDGLRRPPDLGEEPEGVESSTPTPDEPSRTTSRSR
ncbi:lysylphosphatidylglycerol synthase transmembrane domain-containing protein [Salsipaludibacter albus]|uniref:lysylphosphatidylglycerol synthase transmembrane domain-containing protein n=1 Tax=Salsipaludibacter albus TaxID=2849650 RepID=UPI001EE4BE62|nr:flippase-like domain-containing protein [Salsipaludibacter albus]